MFFVFLFCGLVYILIFLNMPLCALLQEDLHFPLMLRQGLLIGWDTPASIQVLSPKVLTSGFSSPLSGAGGCLVLVARSQWWHLNFYQDSTLSLSLPLINLPRLLVWGRPRGNGSGNLPNSINLKKYAWRQKRCVCCASSRFPHSSGRPLRAYVFAGHAGYLMFLVNPSTAYIFSY